MLNAQYITLPDSGLFSGDNAMSVMHCTSKEGWSQSRFCISLIVVSCFVLMTWILGVISCIRVVYVSRKKLNFYSLIHIGIILYNSVVCYFGVNYIYHFLSSSIMFLFYAYFVVKAIRFRLAPVWLTQMRTVALLVCFFLPCVITFSLTLFKHSSHGCGETSRGIYHVLEFILSISFFLFGLIIIFRGDAGSRKHLGLMLLVILFYALHTAINMSIYFHYYFTSNIHSLPQHLDCTTMLIALNIEDTYSILFYKLTNKFYSMFPIWAMYWYLYYASTPPDSQNKHIDDRYFNIQQASEIDSHLFTVDTTTIDGAPSKSVTIGRFQDFLTDDDVPHSMANSLMMDSIIRSKDY